MRDVTIVVAENVEADGLDLGYTHTNVFRLEIEGRTKEFWEYVRKYDKVVAAERLKGEEA